jgi:anti-sigma factor RsiW
MTCPEAEPLLGASLDGELDAATALAIEQHVAQCAACSAACRNLESLRDQIAAADLDWSSSVDLRPLRAAIRRKNHPAWWRRPWANPAFVTAAVAAALLIVFLPGRFALRNADIERQVVDNHVRSLMADHLIDVPSSDRHTVKPWFQGKLPFSPVVPDLTAQGFVLIGGRLDVIAARPAAAIVYKRQNHVVNLWMALASPSSAQPEVKDVDGYHLIRWQRDGMTFWAVSDLNVPELRQFADLIRAQ